MQVPTLNEMRESARKCTSERHIEIRKRELAYKRKQEIRRMARESLMVEKFICTKEEALLRAVHRATRIYDDVEAFEIKPKDESL